MSLPLVLVVEDDAEMQDLYQALFRDCREELACRLEPTGEKAWTFLRREKADVLILDWTLPGLSGLDVLRLIRSSPEHRGLPVFMVSGDGNAEHRVLALESGADDYLVKPFIAAEFLARLRGMFRRCAPADSFRVLEVDNLRLDLKARQVTVAGRPVSLGRKPFDILAYLLRHPDMIHSAERIERAVWGRRAPSLAFQIGDLGRLVKTQTVIKRTHFWLPSVGGPASDPSSRS